MKTYIVHDTNNFDDQEVKAENAKQAFATYAKERGLKGDYKIIHESHAELLSTDKLVFRTENEDKKINRDGYGTVTVRSKVFIIHDFNRGNTYLEADTLKDAWGKYKNEKELNDTFVLEGYDNTTRSYHSWNDEWRGGRHANRITVQEYVY